MLLSQINGWVKILIFVFVVYSIGHLSILAADWMALENHRNVNENKNLLENYINLYLMSILVLKGVSTHHMNADSYHNDKCH